MGSGLPSYATHPTAPIFRTSDVMDADGRNQHPLTKRAPAFGVKTAWAPDGKWIAFSGGDFNLHLIAVTGGRMRRVDRLGHADGSVSWQALP